MERFEQSAIAGKVMLNIQTRSVVASKAATALLGPAVLVGVMAKDYPEAGTGEAYVRELHEAGVQVSAGLGDGSAAQWERALALAVATRPAHLNQIFPAAALSRQALRQSGADTFVNAMVTPSGRPGWVTLGTGPLSQAAAPAVVPVEAALAMMRETGIRSVKFFPIEGTKRLDELQAVAQAAAAADMMVEPTGGITPDNVADIVRVCLEAGVRRIMPHLYGSLKDPATGDLDIGRLERAYAAIAALLGERAQ